jgi:hypothetical protein
VPQAVKLDGPHTGCLPDPLLLVLTNTVHLEWMPEGVAVPAQMLPFLGEHQAMIMIVDPVGQFQFGLIRLVLPE